MDTPLPPSLLELDAYLLSKVGKAARGTIGDRLAARGMRLWHMAVLAALADFGPQMQRELAARLAVHASDVAKVVDDLAGSGYVDRARDPADRRRVRVTLTAPGRAVLAELDAEARAAQEELLSPLTGTERAQLSALLHRVMAHLQDDRRQDDRRQDTGA